MEPNPYDAPKTHGSTLQAIAKWPSSAASIATALAAIAATVFWVMIVDYYRGGHSGDQLIKLGAAGTAICLVVPLACIALSILAWEGYSQRTVSHACVSQAIVNLAVLASPLIYFLD
jgi:hypothetical protein